MGEKNKNGNFLIFLKRQNNEDEIKIPVKILPNWYFKMTTWEIIMHHIITSSP